MTWWITDTSIGQRLKFVRRFRRLTQKELGLLMGYSEKTADVRIAQYEKNARTPNAETTAKLAEVLKVSPVVFSPTICASREDLLQSMYWLFLMKGGGDIYDCETEYARSRMEQKLGVITVEEFLEKMPCMRSSKRTTPMPVPIPFPVGNRKGQSRKNMLPPKPVRIPLRQRLLHLRVQARQRAKQLREPRTSQKE